MRAQEGYTQLPDDNINISNNKDNNSKNGKTSDIVVLPDVDIEMKEKKLASGTPTTVTSGVRNHVEQPVSALDSEVNTSNTSNNGSSSAGKQKSRRSTALNITSSGDEHTHFQESSRGSAQALQSSAASPPKTYQFHQAIVESIASVVNAISPPRTSTVPAPEKSSSTSTAQLLLSQGMTVLLKFMVESKFETRFIWVDLRKRTLHMSQYQTRERRHKEASLTDIVSVEKPAPASFIGCTYSSTSTTAAAIGDDDVADVYATVKFVRGGGIDLRFDSTEARDHFMATMTSIVAKLRTQ
jgi:hypothetical protein